MTYNLTLKTDDTDKLSFTGQGMYSMYYAEYVISTENMYSMLTVEQILCTGKFQKYRQCKVSSQCVERNQIPAVLRRQLSPSLENQYTSFGILSSLAQFGQQMILAQWVKHSAIN